MIDIRLFYMTEIENPERTVNLAGNDAIKGICLFCRKPNFLARVDERDTGRGNFHCSACSRHGSIGDFLLAKYGFNANSAAIYLQKVYSMPEPLPVVEIPETPPVEPKAEPEAQKEQSPNPEIGTTIEQEPSTKADEAEQPKAQESSGQGYGWIKLWKKITNNRFWTSEKFSRGQAWVDLLMFANYKPTKIIIRGITVNLKRGQLAWSTISLARRWQWSEKKVKSFLSELEKEQMLTSRKSNLTTLITIINFGRYQENVRAKDEQKSEQKDEQKDEQKFKKTSEQNQTIKTRLSSAFHNPDAEQNLDEKDEQKDDQKNGENADSIEVGLEVNHYASPKPGEPLKGETSLNLEPPTEENTLNPEKQAPPPSSDNGTPEKAQDANLSTSGPERPRALIEPAALKSPSKAQGKDTELPKSGTDKPKREQTPAQRLVDRWLSLCLELKKHEHPMTPSRWNEYTGIVKRNLKQHSAETVEAMFRFYILSEKYIKHKSLRAALSNDSITLYKAARAGLPEDGIPDYKKPEFAMKDNNIIPAYKTLSGAMQDNDTIPDYKKREFAMKDQRAQA